MTTLLLDKDFGWHMTDKLMMWHQPICAVQYVVRLYLSAPIPGRSDGWEMLSAAILAAPRHGNVCRLLLPPKEARVLGAGATQESIAALLSAGWIVHHASPGERTHAKWILLPGHGIVFGSHNLTRASLTATHELSAWSEDQKKVMVMGHLFERLWQRSSPA